MFVSRIWPLVFGYLAAVPVSSQVPAITPPPPAVHAAFPNGAGTSLGDRIAALLAQPDVARSHWGIAVTALDGTPLYGLDEGKLFRPASNAKVFTSTAAVALLGSQRTFDTKIYGVLDPATGTVRGDLTLVGAGDADFASGDLPYVAPPDRVKNAPQPPALQDLQQMADQLAAHGVKHVTGGIVGDDTLFPWEPYGESWAVDDLLWGYGAPVSALTIADNEMKLTITPGQSTGPAGRPTFPHATVELDQNGVAYYTVVNQVQTVAPHTPGMGVQVEREPGSRTVRVYGTIAEGTEPDTEHLAIDNPAEYAAMALRMMLAERGITVDGPAQAQHRLDRKGAGYMSALNAPDPCNVTTAEDSHSGCNCVNDSTLRMGTVLATHTSAPLAESVIYTMKESQNLHAELLLHQLGRSVPCGEGSTVEGARVRKAFLLQAGLDPDDFHFYDGSGLSAKDLIAPRAAAQLLLYAQQQPWFAAWKPSLPVGGIDGTLAARFKDAPLSHHVFAKTGTLGETNALSGYLDAASGRQVIFSIIVDDHEPGTSANRKAMDEIVKAIAAAE